MKTLEELWLGNINPQGPDEQMDPQIEQALLLVVKNEDKLRAMLTDAQKEQLEKFSDCQSDLTDLLEKRAFSQGFCLAMRIMMEVVNTMEVPSAKG